MMVGYIKIYDEDNSDGYDWLKNVKALAFGL